MAHCECAEEGTRNVVAECLGKLTLIDPPSLLPKLKSNLCSGSALIRSTVITAVKFTISDQVCETSRKVTAKARHSPEVGSMLVQGRIRCVNIYLTLSEHVSARILSKHETLTCICLRLIHCLRRWPNIKPTPCHRLVFAGYTLTSLPSQ